MKKSTCLIAPLLCTFLIAACSNNSNDSAQVSSNTPPDVDTTPAPPTAPSKRNGVAKYITPLEACSLLTSQGMATEGWIDDQLGGDTSFGCFGAPLFIGTQAEGASNPNSVESVAIGGQADVKGIEVNMWIRNRDEADQATQVFIAKNKAIFHSIFNGSNLPSSILNALQDSANAKAKFHSVNVQVKHEDWTSGKGYIVHFIIGQDPD